ncbi:MAG: hypothetical protein OEY21_05870, partial [Nitrospira sp.]|nr:hypothetical protein [Nitrospira sp.]
KRIIVMEKQDMFMAGPFIRCGRRTSIARATAMDKLIERNNQYKTASATLHSLRTSETNMLSSACRF